MRAPGTPTVNGLYDGVGGSGPTGPLLTGNPNESSPLLLLPSDPMTCDQDHAYTAEQNAADHGAEDLYAQNTGRGETLAQCLAGEKFGGSPEPVPAGAGSNFAVMDYYDGNTVTGLWNYAQHFAMNDNAPTSRPQVPVRPTATPTLPSTSAPTCPAPMAATGTARLPPWRWAATTSARS